MKTGVLNELLGVWCGESWFNEGDKIWILMNMITLYWFNIVHIDRRTFQGAHDSERTIQVHWETKATLGKPDKEDRCYYWVCECPCWRC